MPQIIGIENFGDGSITSITIPVATRQLHTAINMFLQLGYIHVDEGKMVNGTTAIQLVETALIEESGVHLTLASSDPKLTVRHFTLWLQAQNLEVESDEEAGWVKIPKLLPVTIQFSK